MTLAAFIETFFPDLAPTLTQAILIDYPAGLAGHICEACLDAPAILLAPAPWGGQMGVCWACAVQQ